MKNTPFLWFACGLLLPACLFGQKPGLKPFQLGVIDGIESKVLNENRILNIYLPEGYSPDSATTYPVIYLLDGSADEDFIHVVGLVQFCNFPWINSLPKSIVVGISNVDRRRDYTFPTSVEQDKKKNPTSGGSAKFIQFLKTELQPYIDKHYKTNQNRMLIGQSLGGLIATEILFKDPGMFTDYLIVSPSLWWDQESLLKTARKPITQATRVIVAVGKEGKIMETDAKKLYQLLQKDTSSNLKTGFDFLKNKNHATIFHQAVFNAFERFNALNK